MVKGTQKTGLREKQKGILMVYGVYLLAGLVAIATGWLFRDQEQWLMVLLADVAATVVVFAFSWATRNSSLYDPYWSVIPIWIVIYLWMNPVGEVNFLRSLLCGLMVWWWGGRLTDNWVRRWQGMGDEDWRYRDLREKTGFWFPAVNFLGIMLMPTVLVFLGCLPLFPALSESAAPFNLLDGLACVVTAGAILIETVSDDQLRAFLARKRSPDEILDTGLWHYSRHPNYFGEVAFWYGIALFGIAALPEEWWRVVGAVAMTALFLGISIPMMEKRAVAKRPHYKEQQRKVSMLVPWWRKKA